MFQRNFNSLPAGWLLAILPALWASSAGAQWGDLKVNFKISGKPPAVKLLPAAPACAAKVPDESFVVDKAGNVKDVVVFLSLEDEAAPLNIHPSYDKHAKDEIVLNNKGCQFVPHITLVRNGQTLTLANADGFGHNANLPFAQNKPLNPIIPAGGKHVIEPKDLARPEKRVIPVTCAIHPFMSGGVLVQNHPYMAVSDAVGDVIIRNLPVGKHKFRFWQESLGHIKPIASTLSFTKGKAEIDIVPGMNNLGTLTIK
jgi:hypothetical protein